MGDWFSFYHEQDPSTDASSGSIERTPLANSEYRAKTGEPLARKPFIVRIAERMAEDPEGCECQVCVRNWEELG